MSTNILVSTSSFGRFDSAPLERLRQAQTEVTLNPHGRKLTAEEIRELLPGVQGLIAGTEPLGREVLSAAPDLRAISRCGTGMDNVDLEAAAELGIEVCNTPDAHVDAVAELALATTLATLRNVVAADRDLRGGTWRKPMGRLLRGSTVGIVGFGRVGVRLAQLLEPFNVKILACDPRQDERTAIALGARYCDLDELLEASDIISLHVPYSASTHHLLDEDAFERMKADVVVINCARGGVVDEEALYGAIQSGKVAGAHMDTFEHEPYTGPLTELPQVVLTPHFGSYAVECRVRMEEEAVENLLRCLENGGHHA